MNRLAINRKLVIPLVVLVIFAVALTAVTAALLSTQQNVPSSGSILGTGASSNSGAGGSEQNTVSGTLNLGIYLDAAATVNCTNINWGALNPGDRATKTVYIKNTGNTETVLSVAASSWMPASASSVLTLTWDKEGATLAAGATVPATLTLQVAQDTGDLSSFSLNIVVSGSAQ